MEYTYILAGALLLVEDFDGNLTWVELVREDGRGAIRRGPAATSGDAVVLSGEDADPAPEGSAEFGALRREYFDHMEEHPVWSGTAYFRRDAASGAEGALRRVGTGEPVAEA